MAALAQDYKDRIEKALYEKNFFTEQLEKMEKQSGAKRLHIVLGLGVFLALYLMVGYGAEFLSSFIGFVYPAYASVKAIESKQKDDDTKWLTYWVVYSLFSLVEFFADIFLFWIPFYDFLKCCFFVYCMVPTSWNGSLRIYNKIIRPYFLKNQEKIDKVLDEAKEAVKQAADQVEGVAAEAVSEAAKSAAKID